MSWNIDLIHSKFLKIKAESQLKKCGLSEKQLICNDCTLWQKTQQFIRTLHQNSPGFLKVPITASKMGSKPGFYQDNKQIRLVK